MRTIILHIKFLSSLKSLLKKDQLILRPNSEYFTVENLITELINELGQKFEDLIFNPKTKNINPAILIFIDNKEIQTLQKLKTPLSDGNKIVFLSSIHGGFQPSNHF